MNAGGRWSEEIRTWLTKWQPYRGVPLRMVGILIAGIVLLLVGNHWEEKPPVPETAPKKTLASNEVTPAAERSGAAADSAILEEKMAAQLSRVRGAGHVTVSISLLRGEQEEYAKNSSKESRAVTERDTGGIMRQTQESKENEQMLFVKENGRDYPVVASKAGPQIKGVLVVAEGARDSAVKAQLTRAVQTGLGVPAYRITVLPEKK